MLFAGFLSGFVKWWLLLPLYGIHLGNHNKEADL